MEATSQPSSAPAIISRAFFEFLKSVDDTPRDDTFVKRAGGVFFANEAREH